MTDINNLDLVPEEIEVDYDNYKDPEEFPPPVPEGVYVLTQGEPEFSATAAKFLQALMHHEVAQGEFQSRRIGYDRISDKPFERNGVKVSMMADHVHALGDKSKYTTHQQFAQVLANGAGKLFKAYVSWEASCPDCTDAKGNRLRVRGERRFPKDEQGNSIPKIACRKCGQMLTAFNRITRRIPA